MKAFDAGGAARALTGGMSIHVFNTEVREKRAARFERALDPQTLADVFDFTRLESLLASEAIPLAYIDIFDDGQLTRLVDMQRKSGKTGLAVVADRFGGGSTIRVRDIDKCDIRLAGFVTEVQRCFSAQSQINLYLTPPGKTGFAPHFDITDVFILQCLGAKQWRLFEDYSNRIELPLMNTDWDPERFKPSSVPGPIPLSAGDVLYLPRGVMHEAFCTGRESMHLTISLMPLTVFDLISRELQRVGAGHVQFRRRVPWSVEENDGIVNEQIAGMVRSCLNELSNSLDVETLLRSERQTLAFGTGPRKGANELTDALAALHRKFEIEPQQVS
jgi:hypothetical protein